MPRSVEDGDGRLHLKLHKILMKHLLEDEVVQLKPYMGSLPLPSTPLVPDYCAAATRLEWNQGKDLPDTFHPCEVISQYLRWPCTSTR